MALPEKDYFKITEICNNWNCTSEDIIQFCASEKFLLHADFSDYVIVEGMYKHSHLPTNIKFGQTICRFFSFDKNFNDLTVHRPNLQNKYLFPVKLPLKNHVKVFLHRLPGNPEKPVVLELGKDYDVNLLENYVKMLIPLYEELDQIIIIPTFDNWLEDVGIYMSKGFEPLRSVDIRKLITKDKIQIEYLQPSVKGYFKCIAQKKDQDLPLLGINNLYMIRQEKRKFEEMYLVAQTKTSINSEKDDSSLNNTNISVSARNRKWQETANQILAENPTWDKNSVVDEVLARLKKNEPDLIKKNDGSECSPATILRVIKMNKSRRK